MSATKPVYELTPDEYLRARIEYLKNQIKELRAEVKRTEDLLAKSESSVIEHIDPKQLKIQEPDAELDFSVTYWKPKVFNFLFENPSLYTTEQILIGADSGKEFQKTKADRNRAIKTISSSLFLLNKDNKVKKHNNEGRRGFKWSVNEPGSF